MTRVPCDLTPALVSGSSALARYAVPFDVPIEDSVELRTYEPEDRALVKERLRAFKEVAAARTIEQGKALAAAKRRHLGRAWSAKTIGELFRVYTQGGYKPGDWKKQGPCFAAGDWRVLANNYRGPAGGLDPDFIAHWVQLWAQFSGRQDTRRAAYDHLIKNQWLAGEPIPGYGRAPEWYAKHDRPFPNPVLIRPDDLPEGWSYENLLKLLPRRRATRNAVAHGYLSAHTHQPDQVLTDRSHLLPFEYVFFDDVRLDKRVRFLGQIVWPLQIWGLDCASGVDLTNVMKGAVEREGGGNHGVSQDCTQLAIVKMLRRWGLPPWKMRIVLENAAATISPERRRMFEDVLGDRVEFISTSIFREKMTAYGFGESGGCPWNKAPLESWYHVLQTHLALGAGTSGPRYDQARGELKKIEAYEQKLLDQAAGRAEVLAALQWTLPTLEEVHAAVEHAALLLRFRTKHELQGFRWLEEARLAAPYQHLLMGGNDWLPIERIQSLPESALDGLELNRRKESPAERFCSLLQGAKFDQLPEEDLLWLEGQHRPVRVRAGKITIDDKAFVDPLIFREPGHALLEDRHEGRAFRGALTADNSEIYLYDDEGTFAGSVLNQARIDRRDTEALHRAAGQMRAARAADRDLLQGYLVERAEAAAAVQRSNAAILAAAGSAPKAIEARAEPTRKQLGQQASLTKRLAQARRDAEQPATPEGSGLYDDDNA